jgi:hypothetical protein
VPVLVATPCAGQILEDIAVIDSPTAGVLPHGGYCFFGSIGPQSSMLFSVKVGFFDRAMLGVSFGLQRFIGRGDVSVNDRPGFDARLRIIEESEAGPAIALGIDTQGEDAYIEADERYERKSKGLYAVLSKNYRFIEDISIHGGVNYSLEDRDEGGLNAFGGLELGVVRGLCLLLDYNPALDDNNERVASHRTRGRGYLDAGARIDYHDNLRFKILFKDLLGNYIPETGVSRSIEVYYINSF